jgi:hypothetical protein
MVKVSGETAVIEPGRTVPLQSGAKVNFGAVEGIIE